MLVHTKQNHRAVISLPRCGSPSSRPGRPPASTSGARTRRTRGWGTPPRCARGCAPLWPRASGSWRRRDESIGRARQAAGEAVRGDAASAGRFGTARTRRCSRAQCGSFSSRDRRCRILIAWWLRAAVASARSARGGAAQAVIKVVPSRHVAACVTVALAAGAHPAADATPRPTCALAGDESPVRRTSARGALLILVLLISRLCRFVKPRPTSPVRRGKRPPCWPSRSPARGVSRRAWARTTARRRRGSRSS